MKKTINILLCGTFILALSACGNKPKDSAAAAEKANDSTFAKTDEKKDSEYAVKAADGGMLEVQLGQLALSNASTESVKALGKMMITDHGKANNELKALAEKKEIVLPATLSNDSQKKYDDLASKSGVDFDKAYSEAMIKDHKEDIELFKKEAEKGNDPDLKEWAAGKISTLEHHLMTSEDAHKAVKDLKSK